MTGEAKLLILDSDDEGAMSVFAEFGSGVSLDLFYEPDLKAWRLFKVLADGETVWTMRTSGVAGEVPSGTAFHEQLEALRLGEKTEGS